MTPAMAAVLAEEWDVRDRNLAVQGQLLTFADFFPAETDEGLDKAKARTAVAGNALRMVRLLQAVLPHLEGNVESMEEEQGIRDLLRERGLMDE